MKTAKKWTLGLGAFVLAALLLVWFLPARLALLWLAPSLHGLRLQQVGGLLWEGHAEQLTTADGQVLGKLHWRLSRQALLGRVQLQLDCSGPRLDFSGAMQKLPAGQVQWRDVRARIDLAALDAYPLKLPSGRPRGELSISISQALLQGGWPLQLQAGMRWANASVSTRDGDIAIGALQLTAQAQNGAVSAQWRDDGRGPLIADGSLQLSPLGWRLQATLQARQADPALRRWLAQFGRPDASGTVHIQHSGGMAMGLSVPPPDRTPD